MTDLLSDRFTARAGLPGDASLRQLVNAVQAIPYGRPQARTADGVIGEWKGTCSTKHALLAQLLRERWPETRPRLVHRVYRVAGWLHLAREPDPLVAHWGAISRLQTHPAFRGRGVGSALMAHAQQVARDEMGLEQLHLAVRGGTGLERFYARLGWTVIGRWPRALRLAPGDDRDEILMVLTPL